MQKLTLSQFIAESGLNPSLVRSTVRQCGGWQSFREMAQDVCNHGAAGGFSGFIYHRETIPFAKRNKKAILDLCKEQASDFGEDMLSFIGGFRCIDVNPEELAQSLYTGKGDNVTEVYNALAWYALEEVSRRYCDVIETFN